MQQAGLPAELHPTFPPSHDISQWLMEFRPHHGCWGS